MHVVLSLFMQLDYSAAYTAFPHMYGCVQTVLQSPPTLFVSCCVVCEVCILPVIVLQDPLNGGTVVWKFCMVVTVFKHLVKSKSSEFYELSDCIQVLSSSSSRFMYSSSRLFKCYKVNCVCFTRAIHYHLNALKLKTSPTGAAMLFICC